MILTEILEILKAQTVIPEELLSISCAVLLGGLIGFERELNGKPAGLRTNILICLGAAIFTIVAGKMTTNTIDASGRIAAGIVTGVGFLGAGALIQEGSGIHGLTTAASIWLVASIGIACGAGFYLLSAYVTVLALVVLLALHPLSAKLRDLRQDRLKKRAQKKAKQADEQSA